MLDQFFLGKTDRLRNQAFKRGNPAIGKVENLLVCEIQGGRKNKTEIVADARLRKWHAVAIRNLAARGGHGKGISGGPALCLPAWSQIRALSRCRSQVLRLRHGNKCGAENTSVRDGTMVLQRGINNIGGRVAQPDFGSKQPKTVVGHMGSRARESGHSVTFY